MSLSVYIDGKKGLQFWDYHLTEMGKYLLRMVKLVNLFSAHNNFCHICQVLCSMSMVSEMHFFLPWCMHTVSFHMSYNLVQQVCFITLYTQIECMLVNLQMLQERRIILALSRVG
jgi:hypothetical protein